MAVEGLAVSSLAVSSLGFALGVKIVGSSAITKSDVEIPILSKDDVSAIVIPLRLIDGEENALAGEVRGAIRFDLELGEAGGVIEASFPFLARGAL